MSVYDEKPWLATYGQGQPAQIAPEFGAKFETRAQVFQPLDFGIEDRPRQGLRIHL